MTGRNAANAGSTTVADAPATHFLVQILEYNHPVAAYRYTYGPVPSRRLGRSLGVDLVPPKTCDFDCIYCQLGRTDRTTVERREYTPVDEAVAEVRRRLEEGAEPDWVTLGGSGEPTLHSGFGDIAARIEAFAEPPLALLTNGSLFYLPEVRAACAPLDLVLPSLDAGDEETFQRINRPHSSLTFERLVEGLVRLREEFSGRMWLEVFIIGGVNSSDEQVQRIGRRIERIDPDRVQINTAVRPPAEAGLRVPSPQRLEEIRRMLGPRAEVIARGAGTQPTAGGEARREEILDMLRRRPCTVRDIAEGLGTSPNEVLKHVPALLEEGRIRRRQRRYETYYEAAE